MRVLIGCEYSGRVRQEFRDLGHDAWSCDFLEAEDESPYHIQGDVLPPAGSGLGSGDLSSTVHVPSRVRPALEWSRAGPLRLDEAKIELGRVMTSVYEEN